MSGDPIDDCTSIGFGFDNSVSTTEPSNSDYYGESYIVSTGGYQDYEVDPPEEPRMKPFWNDNISFPKILKQRNNIQLRNIMLNVKGWA